MNRTIFGYIKYISRKNLIFPATILVLSMVLIFVLPIRDVLFPRVVSSVEDIAEAARGGERWLSLDVENLCYTGYDYYVDYEAKASYYYILDEESASQVMCIFFLLPSTAGSSKADTIAHFSANARIIDTNTHFEVFLEEYCDDIGWTADGLRDACGGILVSSYDYSSGLYLVVLIIIGLIIIICLAYIIANLIIMVDPTRHEACRRLLRFGLDADDFAAIDDELAHDCIINAGNLYITYHYLIAFGGHSIYVVPLFNIIWGYKFSSWNRLRRDRRLHYTLVIVTSPRDKIQVPGNRKKDVDRILTFLEEDFSNIRIGYTEEIRDEIEELLQIEASGSGKRNY